MTTPDIKVISKMAEILEKSNLTELEYEDEGCRICLTRDFSTASATVYTPMPQPVAHAAPAAQAAAPAPAAEPVKAEDHAKDPNAVKSPMVGVIYLSPDPSSAPYVKVGDSISAGSTICLIEAMKTFNPVKAHKSGKVTKILVETGAPAEYGEPLMIIE